VVVADRTGSFLDEGRDGEEEARRSRNEEVARVLLQAAAELHFDGEKVGGQERE